MGCGSSTDSVKSESKASLGTAPSSRASSGTRIPKLRNKGRVAPEVLIDNGSDSPAVVNDKCLTDVTSTGQGIGNTQATQLQKPTGSGDEVTQEREVITNNNDTGKQQKSVAFEVLISPGVGESIVKKHPPRRLQKLENAPRPTFTLEELEERQQKSAARRKKALEKKKSGSKQSSRRRNQLLAAVKFSEEHHQQVTAKKLDEKNDSASKNRKKHQADIIRKLQLQEERANKGRLDEKIDSASKNREKHQADVIRKQQLREVRAHQAQERRRRASFDDEIEYDVEKDETFNVDDDADSWLDSDNNNSITNMAPYTGSASTTASERIYDGRSSPAKQIQEGSRNNRQRQFDSDESETEAFSTRREEKQVEHDEFFD